MPPTSGTQSPTSSRIPRWFLPIAGDLASAASTSWTATRTGPILTCDPPREFTATWECGDDVSWIEVRITSEDAHRSRFELHHISHVDDHWEQFGPGAVGMGYDGALVGLTIHLATGEAVDPRPVKEWMASEDGRRFMKLSGEAWYEANMAAGADPALGESRRRSVHRRLPGGETRTRSSQPGTAEIFSMSMHAQTPVQIAWVTTDLDATEKRPDHAVGRQEVGANARRALRARHVHLPRAARRLRRTTSRSVTPATPNSS